MHMKWKLSIVLALGLLLAAAVLVACGTAATPCPDCPKTECPTAEACAKPETSPTAEACPTCPEVSAGGGVTTTCPYGAEWSTSAHADKTAAAFNDWNADTPAEVPAGCAKCHTSSGYADYVAGIEKDLAFQLAAGVPVGEVVSCNACHDPVTQALSVIPFPSGLTVTVEGPEGRCMVCHQGRAAGSTVDAAIAKQAPADDDTVANQLGFTNVHYKAAAATLYGSWVKGGYEYPGLSYDVKFAHTAGYDTCLGCHNQHTLEVKVESCTCHELKTIDDAKNIREPGSLEDYNGNGDITEGIYYEVQGLQDTLLKSIQMYATEVSTGAIAYDAASYPYWFYDVNANGAVDSGEGTFKGWTGRLLKAAYNYQFSIKDPGSFAHNGKYIIELLYDSVASLNEKLSKPIDMSKMHRNDAGHFDSSAAAFRHWDAPGATGNTETGCVKCHNAEGLPQFIENGANIAMPVTSNLYCSTCHNEAAFPARYEVTTVAFPSGATVDSGNPDSNLCLECHQGRVSTVQIDQMVEGKDPDTVDKAVRFQNVHYFAAGATLFGTEVKGAYEYEGQTYVGRNQHVQGFTNCTECHDVHALTVKVEACKGCHGTDDPAAIRMSTVDYNGNGDTKEGIEAEVTGLQDILYAAIQTYAKDKVGTAIVYSPAAYPYFFADANGNGTVDEGEGSFSTWTPRLAKAAYNLQYSIKDPGDFAHNPKYTIQILFDSIKDIGGDVSKLARP
jgi:hypothetical protein